MSIAEKLQIIAENEEKVYNAGYEKGKAEGGDTETAYNNGFENGKQAEYDRFWDSYQQNGKKVNYECAFGGDGWNDETFKPKYDIQPTDAYMMFRSTGITDLTNLNVDLDFSKATNMQYMFQWANTRIIGTFNATSVNNLGSTFYYAIGLQTIEKLVLRENGSNTFTDTFASASKLANITIEGTIGNNFDIHYSPLTKESITSIINALSVDVTGKTVTFSKTAVQNAFGTDYDSSTEWTTLKNSKSNWTITLS